MENISFTKDYITKNGKPWFPVMGEFHYSRYPKEYWMESLYKMKAGGVQVVSTYTIWIHHEEIENEYDFSGNRDLKSFIEICKEVGIYLFLRIGPWVHAEVRNGGFPDWMLQKSFRLRTNDEEYLKEVKKFYGRIFEEAKGFFQKDGGPIIGIQIENEYGHCGGGLMGDDPEAERHMQELTKMSKEIGYDVPLYTATGWGGAATGGLLPVMGGYCDAPWDQRITEIEPSGNFIFTYERNDHNIGSDFCFGHGITFDINKFPYLTAELGGGLQVTRHRRTVATSKDIGAMSLVKIGSGCNLLGYYMYHGGTNPKGKLTTLNESRETGYPNDLNELNYDFRAAIKEYGQISETFKEIKLLSLFVADFGEELCKMPAYIPGDNPLQPSNFSDLRYSIRHNGQWGFLFVNNYVRRAKMNKHNDVQITTQIGEEKFELNIGNVENGEFFFYPINMPACINGRCITGQATPLCKINDEIIFYGKTQLKDLISITREEALNAYKISSHNMSDHSISNHNMSNYNISNHNIEKVIISESPVICTENEIEIYTNKDIRIKVYPDFENEQLNLTKVGEDGVFTLYDYKYKSNKPNVIWNQINDTDYELIMEGLNENLYDAYLNIDYTAEMAELFIDYEKVADEFYAGEVWQVGLRKFHFPNKLLLKLKPLEKNAEIYFEETPIFSENENRLCKVDNVCVEIIEKVIITNSLFFK